MNCAVITAAGKSTRLGGIDKQILKICGHPVLAYTVRVFQRCPLIDKIVITAAKEKINQYKEKLANYSFSKLEKIVPGGKERQDSIFNALEYLSKNSPDIVAIHDGVVGTTPIKEITSDYSNKKNLSFTIKGTYQGSFHDLVWVNDSTGGILVKYGGILGVQNGEMIVVTGVLKTIDILLVEFPYLNATDIHQPWVLK